MSIREFMLFRNSSMEHTLNLDSVGLGKVAPGATVEIPIALCAAGRADNGSRTPSSIECVAPQLKPVDETEGEEWNKAPEPLPPRSVMVTTQGRAPQEPAGVAAVRRAQAAAKAKRDQEAADKSNSLEGASA